MNNEIDFYTVLQSVKKSFLEELQKYPSKSYKNTYANEISTIFCWYDSKSDSLESITNKIKEGLEKAFQYSLT